MKPIAYQELFSFVSCFLNNYKTDVPNQGYIDFFLNDFKVPCLPNREEVAPDDVNFYFSRLTQKLSNKEKQWVLVLFLELCKQNNVFQTQPLMFIDNCAKQLDISSRTLAKLKQLTLLTLSSDGSSDTDSEILILQHKDFILLSEKKPVTLISNDPQPVLAYFCNAQEQIAFVKTSSEKATINGVAIGQNKVYPFMEGDILLINECKLPFNSLLHSYYHVLPFPALQIIATGKTPAVMFDSQKKQLEITGSSIPEDGMAFFRPLIKWVDSYLMTLPNYIEVKIQLDYFNTTSSKFILDILKRLESYKKENVELIVNWYFAQGDEDLEEAGLHYSELVKIPFALIPYN